MIEVSRTDGGISINRNKGLWVREIAAICAQVGGGKAIYRRGICDV